MNIFYKNLNYCFNLFFILFLLFENTISDTPSNLFCENEECKSILFEGTIIFIKNSESEPYIYSYDERAENKSIYQIDYDPLIQNNKGILKLNENEFLIHGLNNNQVYFYCQKFFISKINGNINIFKNGGLIRKDIGLEESYFREPPLIFNIRVITNSEKLIISAIFHYIFRIILIDLDRNNLNPIAHIQIDNNNEKLPIDTKSNIQCDSLDESNFHCVFYYSRGSMFYINRNFNDNSQEELIGSICSENCFNGNIVAINSDKYLVCYQKKLSSSNLHSISCLYYSYSTTLKELNLGRDHEFFITFSYEPQDEPLILYRFDNSILIEFDCDSVQRDSPYIIITSLDFNLKYSFQISSEEVTIPTVNFYNDKNFFYLIYKNGRSSYIKKQLIIPCKNVGNITLSNTNRSFQINLTDGHEYLDIGLLINDNIQLEPQRDKYISTNSDKRFIFNKKEGIAGVFDNYYQYSNVSNIFSLICKISITSCYYSCDECAFGKVGNPEEHFCKRCLSGYLYKTEDNNKDEYNCYLQDELIEGYYKDSTTKKFEKCHETCEYCDNSYSCEVCNNTYYFKFENGSLNKRTICFKGDLPYYYLSTNELIINPFNSQYIYSVYKNCFKSCFSCSGDGTYENNNCLNCSKGYIPYEFNKHQCLIDHDEICFKQKQEYWKIDKNNITCEKECKFSIILDGKNRGQCVENCTNFLNPHLYTTMFFTLVNCNNQNYCIPFDVCNNGHFIVNYEQKTCISKSKCDINIFDPDTFSHYYQPVIETTIEAPVIITERPFIPGEKRQNIIKIILKEDENYTNYNISDYSLINEYIRILNKEYEQIGNDTENGIYLVIFKKYFNFNITIYPLDIESFVHDNVILPNNLGFVNFNNYFTEYNYYKTYTNEIILVILLERMCLNSSINDLNYYFFGMKENLSKNGKFLNISNLNLRSNDADLLKTMFPLKSYYNENSSLAKRNSEYLIENIRSFNSKYPNIELYNINDPFFNDICFQFSSEIDTDVTLNDRRKEYYVNKSLCEDNCYLEKLLINENNIKSVCSCKFKNEYSFNKNVGIKDDIPPISKSNIKSILCIKKYFTAENISKNPIFWVFVILTFFLLIMFLVLIIYGNSVLKKIFHLETTENHPEDSQARSENAEIKENKTIKSDESDKKIKINPDDDNISDIKFIKKKDSLSGSKNNESDKEINSNNKYKKIIKINNMKKMSIKNSSIYGYNDANHQKDSLIPIDSFSLNNNKSNPPKKIIKNIDLKENKKRFNYNIINDAIYQTEENEDVNNKERREYYIDIFEDDNKCEIKDNYIKNFEGQNSLVPKLLEGEDILNENNSKIGYNSDNFEEKKFNKNKKGFKENEFAENEFLPQMKGNFLSNYKISESKNTIKNEPEKRKEINNTKNLINENSCKNKISKDDILTISEIIKNGNKQKIMKKHKRPFINSNIKEYSGENRQEEYKKKDKIENEINIEDKKKMKSNIKDFINDVTTGKEESNSFSNKIINSSVLFHNNGKDAMKNETKNLLSSGKIKNIKKFNFKEEEKNGVKVLFANKEFRINWKKNVEKNIKIKKDENIMEMNTNKKEIIVPSFNETITKKEEINFGKFYWSYFKNRELILLCFSDIKYKIPFFIRWLCFIFYLFFILMLNFLFLFRQSAHDKFDKKVKGEENNIKYYSKDEFIYSIYVSFISTILKIIIIKLIFNRALRMKKEIKKKKNHSHEKELTETELENMKNKKINYSEKYHTRLKIYFVIIFSFSLLIAYICIIYSEIFLNYIFSFLLGFVFSIIFNFIFSAIICLVITIFYKLGKKSKNKYLLFTYMALSTIY